MDILPTGTADDREERRLGMNEAISPRDFLNGALLDEQGQILRWYATGTDIDDRKRAEDRMRNETLALREDIDRAAKGRPRAALRAERCERTRTQGMALCSSIRSPSANTRRPSCLPTQNRQSSERYPHL